MCIIKYTYIYIRTVTVELNYIIILMIIYDKMIHRLPIAIIPHDGSMVLVY